MSSWEKLSFAVGVLVGGGLGFLAAQEAGVAKGRVEGQCVEICREAGDPVICTESGMVVCQGRQVVERAWRKAP